MGKLRLKRTPEEQAAHDLRKAQKRARKAAKHGGGSTNEYLDDEADDERASKKRRAESSPQGYSYVFDEEELIDDAGPSHRDHKPDYDAIYAELEEARFREKLSGAFDDDERLDSVEARLNSYAHVPRRWRGGGMERMDDELGIEPQMMEDEDYAEWVRAGMWKKKHAAEFAEQERKKAERAARMEREKALREDTARMERAEEERRRQRRTEKERKRWDDARREYEDRWKELLAGVEVKTELRFHDIPWPVLVAEVGPSLDAKVKRAARLEIEDLTVDAVSAFLLPGGRTADSSSKDKDTIKKERRDKLRESMLRFHPDKFEGRVMKHVREKDQALVREAVGRITRAINDLLAAKDA